MKTMKRLAVALMVAFCFCVPAVALAATYEKAEDPFEDAVAVDMPDGMYTVDIAMEGGSGKATIDSPAALEVRGGKAAATVQWSSPNYDYMVVGDKQYLPVNTGGNSAFTIPVLAFDEPMNIVGDTTAMSQPHEVEYKITFDKASVKAGSLDEKSGSSASSASSASASSASSSQGVAQQSSNSGSIMPVIIVTVLAIAAGLAFGVYRGMRNKG